MWRVMRTILLWGDPGRAACRPGVDALASGAASARPRRRNVHATMSTADGLRPARLPRRLRDTDPGRARGFTFVPCTAGVEPNALRLRPLSDFGTGVLVHRCQGTTQIRL